MKLAVLLPDRIVKLGLRRVKWGVRAVWDCDKSDSNVIAMVFRSY